MSRRKKERVAHLFGPEEQMRRIAVKSPLRLISRVVDWEAFRPILDKATGYADGTKGGRPPYDVVLMLKILVLASLHNLSDEKTELLVMDRLSWLDFLGLRLGEATPDANTIRNFREKLKQVGVIEAVFEELNRQQKKAGYIATGGQLLDSTLVKAPKQRLRREEREAIKEGKSQAEIWPESPPKARQKDVDARWTVVSGRKPLQKGGKTSPQRIIIPYHGYKNHISMDRKNGLIRKCKVTDAASSDGKELPKLLDEDNTHPDVWADTAYRSRRNEELLKLAGRVSHIHEKKPRGKAMPEAQVQENLSKSRVRALVEHVFAVQKVPEKMGIFIRTIGKERAKVKLYLANITYNLQRMVFLDSRLR